ncbi:MAG: hypothetical protein ACP5UF_06585 [Hydrogenobaculum sp.]
MKNLLRKYLKKVSELQKRLDGAKKKNFTTHILENRLSKTWLKIKRLLKHYAIQYQT